MIAGLVKFAGPIAEGVGLYIFIFGVAAVLERRHPVEPDQSKRAILLDCKLAVASIVLSYVFAPISGAIIAMSMNMTGAGFITLRGDGWWFPLSLAIAVLGFELQGYWFHRLQHSVSFLWSMHSLHHSAEAMTAVTAARHYWFERAIVVAFLPNLAILFKIPPDVLVITTYLYLIDLMGHLNLKASFGPFTYIFVTPQYHRIHHSIEPQHYNKNFCKNFPIIDIIFGTAWIPAKDEFPRTGVPNERPTSLIEGIVWPFRHVTKIRALLDAIPSSSRRLKRHYLPSPAERLNSGGLTAAGTSLPSETS
jgi:sterol desaturase/sphingolipid hydroxylase (fatty acid hydroxylase superfamily)